MKITSMNPVFVAKDVSGFISLYKGMFGFSVKHVLNAENSTVTVLENADGVRIDAVQRNVEKSYMGVRINVDNFEDALKEHLERGFMIIEEENTPSNRLALIVRENGTEILLVQHRK